ncbi:PAS domain S-box protein [Falsigemmobacter faecalis]|uniref:PAS domain S-box protein n=1 Tax=Falsigemmobacter faecalis TaxID=2488730 RepID=UPI00131573AD|nr:PAS domain S-box protein [Falsigemmobacter faecalis]
MTELKPERRGGFPRKGSSDAVSALVLRALRQPADLAVQTLLAGAVRLCPGAVGATLLRPPGGGQPAFLPDEHFGGTGPPVELCADHLKAFRQGRSFCAQDSLFLPVPGDVRPAGLLRLHLSPGAAAPTAATCRALGLLAGVLAALLLRLESERAAQAAALALEATKQRLHATLRAMPDLVLEVDDDGVYTDIHTSEPALLAQVREQMLGRSYHDVLPPDVADIVGDAMERARHAGRAHGCRYMLKIAGGERWFEASVGRTRPAPHQPGGGFVVVVRDITAEEQRRTELIGLGHVARQMSNYALMMDAGFRVTWVNRAFEERCGYRLPELLGRDPREVLRHAEADSASTARMDAAIAACRPERVEVCNADRSGQAYWVDSSLTPIRDEAGGLIGFVAVEVDITERRAQDQALAAASAEAVRARDILEAAINVLPDAFSIYDAEDRLVLCNEKYREFFAPISDEVRPGATREALLRSGLRHGRHPEAVGREEDFIAERVARARICPGVEEVRLGDGRWYRLWDRLTPSGERVGMQIDITDIRMTQQKLEDVLAVSAAGTWEYDNMTDVLTFNDRWAEMLGFDPGALTDEVRRAWTKLIHPEDKVWLRPIFRALATGEIDDFAVEYRLRHQEGHWIWVQTRGRAMLRSHDGTSRRLVGANFDITPLKQASARIEQIIRGAAVGTWEEDERSGETRANDLWWQMLGYDTAVENFGDWRRLLHPDDRRQLDAVLERVRTGEQEQFEITMRLRHREGRWVWVLSRGQATQRADDGRTEVLSGIHIDVTAAKAREIDLQQANARLREALAGRDLAERRFADIAAVSPDWFWETDSDSRFTFVSDGFAAQTGRPVARLMGMDLRSFARMSPAVPPSAGGRDFEERLRCGEVFRDFVWLYPARLEGEREIWVRSSGLPFFDADGIFMGYRGVSSDITDLYLAKERAEAASRAKSQFLANMSHEIRTPLNGVLGMADLLAARIKDPEEQSMIATIRDSGEGLLTVLNDILDIARVEAGKLSVVREPFRPADLADRLTAVYALRAEQQGLWFTLCRDAGASGYRYGDAHRLLQVLYNLVSNALKFTHAGGVDVALVTDEAGGLCITVRDSGIGMSPAKQARAFEDFEQADGAITRRYGGTGLGLAISRRLIALMGGEITLKSQEGEGTEMTVRLPPDPVPADALPGEVRAQADLTGMRVLFADDNATNRLILKSMLTRLGVDVTLATDGGEAVALSQTGQFDALLLDISMPDLDGVSALAQIRATAAAGARTAPPAAAVTANVMTHQIESYLAAGFDGCLGKPFRRTDLVRLLSDFRNSAAQT